MGHDVSPTRVLRPRPDSPEGEEPRNLHAAGRGSPATWRPPMKDGSVVAPSPPPASLTPPVSQTKLAPPV